MRKDLPFYEALKPKEDPDYGFVRGGNDDNDGGYNRDDGDKYGEQRDLMSEDMRREAERQRWEDEQREVWQGVLNRLTQ